MLEKIFGRVGYLFDSHVYILKAFVAVFLGQVIFSQTSFIGKDMISLLFGLMLALEPLIVSSLKTSFEMIWQSAFAGLIGLVIFTVFGLNSFTIPLVVVVAMFISLRFSFRTIPTVLYFTAIYMGQYIQYGPDNQPDFFQVFLLRISALSAGVLVAFVVNFVFYKLFYKNMEEKRAIFIAESVFELTINPSEKLYIQFNRDLDLVEQNISSDTRFFREARNVGHYIYSMILEDDNFGELLTPTSGSNAEMVQKHIILMKEAAEESGFNIKFNWVN